ncbi:uncharacterized protein LY79DRAFT_590982 [Colletotrichum navitas]|uniref:Uncharacterized protein n=1 Tax=Colletotrichum navitas TaxID=681940 RepID=A0AAD8PX57_9PEZI|nr:uncharacterized protein LY79DRAFT_590982 [Colletotrichum navitas]KAK1589700.1 hypothetical protein LY79DRAFT_590982 [Colletotrichum navitas]
MWLSALASSPFISSTLLVNIRDLEPRGRRVTSTWFDSTVFDAQPTRETLLGSSRIGVGATFEHPGFYNMCSLRASSWDALEKRLMRVAFGNPSGIGP